MSIDEFDEWLDKCPVDVEFQDEINGEGTLTRFYLFRIPDDDEPSCAMTLAKASREEEMCDE